MEEDGEKLGSVRWKTKLTGRIPSLSDKKGVYLDSTVGKKMPAVHFILMPCEPNTSYKAQRKPTLLEKANTFTTLLHVY